MMNNDDAPATLRLLLKTSIDHDVEGEICLVDIKAAEEAAAAVSVQWRRTHDTTSPTTTSSHNASLMMNHIMNQISNQTGVTDIDRLCHVVYGQHSVIQGIAKIQNPQFLRDMDVVLAMTTGEDNGLVVGNQRGRETAVALAAVTDDSPPEEDAAANRSRTTTKASAKKQTKAKKRKSSSAVDSSDDDDDDDNDEYIPEKKQRKKVAATKKKETSKQLFDNSSDEEFVYNEDDYFGNDDGNSSVSSGTPMRTRYIDYDDDDEDMLDAIVDDYIGTTTTATTTAKKPKAKTTAAAKVAKKPKAASQPKKKRPGKTKKTKDSAAAAQPQEEAEPIELLGGLPSPPKKARKALYDVGTKVRKLFNGYGWYEGYIKEVNMEDKKYKIQYDDGDAEDIFMDEDQDVIDQIVYLATPEGRKATKEMKKGRGGGYFKSVINTTKAVSLSDDERAQLYGKEINMDDFLTYLKDVEDIEDYNYRRVIKEVTTFRSGDGQRYEKWIPDGIAFYEGRPFGKYLHENYAKMQKEAVEFQKRHGKNMKTSNPWLLKHPLRKLENYQIYYYNKYIAYSNDNAANNNSNNKTGDSTGNVNDAGNRDEMEEEPFEALSSPAVAAAATNWEVAGGSDDSDTTDRMNDTNAASTKNFNTSNNEEEMVSPAAAAAAVVAAAAAAMDDSGDDEHDEYEDAQEEEGQQDVQQQEPPLPPPPPQPPQQFQQPEVFYRTKRTAMKKAARN